MDSAYLKKFFPEAQSIPAECRLQQVHQKEYVINGTIKEQKGTTRKDFLPICISREDSLP
jgi:hypothetical protein